MQYFLWKSGFDNDNDFNIYHNSGVVGITVSRNISPSCAVEYRKLSLQATLVSRFTKSAFTGVTDFMVTI